METDNMLLKENCSVFRCRTIFCVASLWTCVSVSWSTCKQPRLCVRVRLRTLNSCHLFFLGIQANVLGASLSSTGPGRTALHRAFVSRPLGTNGLGFGVIFSYLAHAEMLLLAHWERKRVCQFQLFVACWHFWKDTLQWDLKIIIVTNNLIWI